jgi:hypothetical protein
MISHILRGTLGRDGLVVSLEGATQIVAHSALSNKGEEALVALGDGSLLSLHEVNGWPLGKAPRATLLAGGEAVAVPTPWLAYRLTDATAPDPSGCFWVVNYQWSGDRALRPTRDALTERWGTGASHKGALVVERLVTWCLQGDAVLEANRPPILLELGPEPRNWEGVVRFDEGLLLVTDRHPQTLLGYVPL